MFHGVGVSDSGGSWKDRSASRILAVGQVLRWLLSCVPAGVAVGTNSTCIHIPPHTHPWASAEAGALCCTCRFLLRMGGVTDTVLQKGRFCRFPKNEKQPSLDKSLGEAVFGKSPGLVAEVIDVISEIIELGNEKYHLGCQPAHVVKGAQD